MKNKKEEREIEHTWEAETIRAVRVRNKHLTYAVFTLFVLLILTIIAIASIAPLKTVEGIPILIDRRTGTVDVRTNIKKTMNKKDIEAVKQSLIAQYVQWWKTYDVNDFEERQKKINLFSTKDSWSQYRKQFSYDDDRNPHNYYKESEKATVEITSIVVLNNETYQVRFALIEELRNQNNPNIRYFTATIRVALSGEDLSEKDTWSNPIGLAILSIRFDEEFKVEE